MFWGEFVVAFLGDVVLFFSLGTCPCYLLHVGAEICNLLIYG